MEISVLTTKNITSDIITNADYYSYETGELSFSRDIMKTPSGSRYHSYSSMVDNLIYQPSWIKNAYELGNATSETENISIGANSYIYDRIPQGISKVIYKNSGEKLIEVRFTSRSDGIVEHNYNQVLLLKFEAEDSILEDISPNKRIHCGDSTIEGVGHKFHRAYNAIQYQDGFSVASKLLIAAIFDTFDIDFSKGTLIGADSSKFFVGNRIKFDATPVIHNKFANKIIEKDNNILKDLLEDPSLEEIEISFNKYVNDVLDFDVIELSGFGDVDGYYRVRSNNGNKTLTSLKSEEIPCIFPIYTNEETTDTAYFKGNDSDELESIYYPPSQGVLFEYEKNGNIGENLYYYINSPIVDSGILTTDEEHEVVGTRLKDSENELKTLSVMNIFQGTDYSLSEDQSQWKYNRFGELIINEKQINKTYPML